jgi:hypothetical protein
MMPIDVEEFMKLRHGKAEVPTAADDHDALEAVAAAIHETWRALAREEGWSMQPHLDRPYSRLAEPDKEDNRAAARRIPEVLALVGLGLSRDEDGEAGLSAADQLRAQLEQNMERLAEAEHDGWMEQRRRDGWRYAETRDDSRKLHPAMVPYAELPEREKGKDRNSVRHYPDFAARAGYRIAPVA